MTKLTSAILCLAFCLIYAACPALGQDAAPIPGAADTAAASPRLLAHASLVEAASIQRQALSIIASILSQQQLTSSDGQILMDLDVLIQDETMVQKGINQLGPKTLGRTADQLQEEDRKQLEELVRSQQVSTDRYARIQLSIERNALERPDSVFSKMLIQSAESGLSDHMQIAPQLLAENQLTKAIVEVNLALEGLIALRDLLGSSMGEIGAPAQGDLATTGFVLPSLTKGLAQVLPFNYTGETMDFLVLIPMSIEELEKLAREQRVIANAVKQATAPVSNPASLAERELAVYKGVIEVSTGVGIIDAQVNALLISSASTVDIARTALLAGNVAASAEPAEKAAVDLATAAVMLKEKWEKIMDLLMEWTREAEAVMASSINTPHGQDKKLLEELRQKVMLLLRATGGLSQAVVSERRVLELTQAGGESTGSEAAREILAASQESIAAFLGEQVIPFEILVVGESDPESGEGANADTLIKSASAAIVASAASLRASDIPSALVKERQAVAELEDALADLVRQLQQLLGQFATQAQGKESSQGKGRSMRPPDGTAQEPGWNWDLLKRELDEMENVTRGGDFPDKYDREIKAYFNSLADAKPE